MMQVKLALTQHGQQINEAKQSSSFPTVRNLSKTVKKRKMKLGKPVLDDEDLLWINETL